MIKVTTAAPHDYLSTACYHDLHDQCRKTCKFCFEKCKCPCHANEDHTKEPRMKPIAWTFELASLRNKETGEYSGWRHRVQFSRPHAPVGSIRNLRPLFAGEEQD